MAKVTILPIGLDVIKLWSAMKTLRSQVFEVNVEIIQPLQTTREVEKAFSGYVSVKPDIIVLDHYIIDESGRATTPEEVIKILDSHRFNGPIIAWADSCNENFNLMGLGATHRVDVDSNRARREEVSIDERLKGTKQVILGLVHDAQLEEAKKS